MISYSVIKEFYQRGIQRTITVGSVIYLASNDDRAWAAIDPPGSPDPLTTYISGTSIPDGGNFAEFITGPSGPTFATASTTLDDPADSIPTAHAASHRLGGSDVIDSKPLIGEAMTSGTSTAVMAGYGWMAYGSATDVSSARDVSADGIGFKQSSAASAATGGVYHWPIQAFFDTGWLPKVRVKVKLDTVATVRYFFGLSSDNGANTVADDDPATYQCGFQFSTARGDSNWQLALDDNGTQVLTDTGLAAATGVLWFEVDITAAGSCKFTIQNGVGVELYSATISANVPSAGNLMYFVHGGETQAAVAINPITYRVQAYSP